MFALEGFPDLVLKTGLGIYLAGKSKKTVRQSIDIAHYILSDRIFLV